ncbi:hypothetical protein J2X76_004763 [Neorhizobium sp. 2083]|uniref:hypothetical protein n=1 Tax=Neorhizobium sp. 2083 TaxID=2817762 RepID=UPI0028649BAA|nr:hypothetical protein [Neorhizobium sp. 2083]MDR6819571.1 hypothetical protein [Neorhizobium sp. 2083]
MDKHPYDIIAVDEKARIEFYRLCKKRIKLLRQHGFIDEAVLHAKALKSIKDDLAALAEFD